MTTAGAIKGLGEIALQVHDLDRMTEFYASVVGLPVLKRFPAATFFQVAAGVDGHTQVLALFDRADVDGYTPTGAGYRRAPLDHLAFGISLESFEPERARLQALGCDVSESVHDWVGWRSLYIQDPEGNQVEWVCYDESILDANV